MGVRLRASRGAMSNSSPQDVNGERGWLDAFRGWCLLSYSVFRSSCIVSCGCEVVGAFDGCEDVDEAPDGGPKALNGPLGGFAQERFELGEGILNRVEIRAVGREIKQACPRRLDQGSHSRSLVAR